MEAERQDQGRGYAAILAVYLIWGLLPAYWKLMAGIPPLVVLAHRALWAFLILGAVRWYRGPARAAEVSRGAAEVSRGRFWLYALAGLSLAAQWVAYLAAVSSGKLVELSLGYYIYPLITALLGTLFLGEALDRSKVLALISAGAGVAILVALQGGVPLLALALAVSFAVYSVVKKRIKAAPLDATLYELLMLLPAALWFIARSEAGGQGWFLRFRAEGALLLIGGGVATALTLLLFATGARKIPMFALGFLQYISPTIVLALGVFAYGERFDMARALGFGGVWLGVAIYAAPGVRSLFQAPRRHHEQR